MNEAERIYIGEAWIESGLGEHASVASFARFTLDLMSLGAPPELLYSSIQAMKEEVHHATLCFGVASKFLQRPVSPGPLNLDGIFSANTTASAMLESAISEGCVSETISLAYAAEGMELTADEGIKSVLKTIVVDESRHSKLAWDFVEWLIKRDESLLGEARNHFRDAVAVPYVFEEGDDDFMIAEQFGHIRGKSKKAVRDRVIGKKIVPRAARLLNVEEQELSTQLAA